MERNNLLVSDNLTNIKSELPAEPNWFTGLKTCVINSQCAMTSSRPNISSTVSSYRKFKIIAKDMHHHVTILI